MNAFDQHNQIRYYRHVFDDMPIGDPMGGPAYGQFRKSKGLMMVIGIVAAVATMGAGVAVMAAGTLAAQISGGAMIAGGLMSGIGAVTGNKKLAMIGGVLSLAGGIGAVGSSMATGAGWGGAFAEGSGSSALTTFAKDTMGTFSSVFSGGTSAPPTAPEQMMSPQVQADTGSVGSIDVSGAPKETLPIDQSARAAELANADVGGTISITEPSASPTVTAAPAEVSAPTVSIEPVRPNVQGPATPGGANEVQANASLKDAINQGKYPQSVPGGTGGPPAESKGLLSQAWDALNSPVGKEIASGAIKGIGGALLTDKDQEAAKSEYYQSAANAQNANASATATAEQIAKQKEANKSAVPIGLDPSKPDYEQKKAAAEAAGYRTFDIATPAAQGPVTRTPVQSQYTSTPVQA
jgi:hypothetical protein